MAVGAGILTTLASSVEPTKDSIVLTDPLLLEHDATGSGGDLGKHLWKRPVRDRDTKCSRVHPLACADRSRFSTSPTGAVSNAETTCRNHAGAPRPRWRAGRAPRVQAQLVRDHGAGTVVSARRSGFDAAGRLAAQPPSDWRESVQGLMGAHSRLRNGRSRELQAGAASSPRGRMPAGTWLPAVLLLSPGLNGPKVPSWDRKRTHRNFISFSNGALRFRSQHC
jgi:hypothetical protein